MTVTAQVYDKGPIIAPSQPVDFASTAYNLSLYALETTQRYRYGTRFITEDGRVFKYGKAASIQYAGYGSYNSMFSTVARLINSVTPAAISIGDKTTTVTIAATEGAAGDGVVAENELAGGYIVVGHGAAATTENRMIESNTAVASGGGTTTITVDFPFAVAHSAGVACECPANPYRSLTSGLATPSDYAAWMGVPGVYSASGNNIWIQTWGPCWCVPGGGDTTPGNTADDRMAFFVGDGSVNFGTSLTVETGYQPAGFCIDATASGTSAMPLVMLQISI